MALLGASPLAFAQPDADVKRARALFTEAQTHYKVGEFEFAIEKYKKAYKLSKASALLFNIAQAYRLDGDARNALLFYQNYLREVPDADNRADAEARIAETREDQPMKVIIERREVTRGSRPMRIGGAVTGAVGLLGVGAGVFLAVRAKGKWDDINALNDGGTWTPEFADKFSSAERDETLATVFVSVGAAAVVAGGVLYYLGLTRGVKEKKVSMMPTGNGAAVVWSF
jgi:tetratricopeptide (TPR) repeat protein